MKKVILLMAMVCGLVGTVPCSGQGARGLDGSSRQGEGVKKIGLKGRVLQVLEKGYLMEGRETPWFLAGYRPPKGHEVADGDVINCYVVKTGATFRYEDTTGAMRTVRVYRWAGRRLGG